jgi:hypothetical protein
MTHGCVDCTHVKQYGSLAGHTGGSTEGRFGVRTRRRCKLFTFCISNPIDLILRLTPLPQRTCRFLQTFRRFYHVKRSQKRVLRRDILEWQSWTARP